MADFDNGWALAFIHLNDEAGRPKKIVTTLHELGIPDEANDGEAMFRLTDAFTKKEYLITKPSVPFDIRINPSGIVMLIVEKA